MAGDATGVESLYPFLYRGAGDLEAVLEEVRRSTVAKVQEIVALRETVLERDGARLAECARAMAASFAAGGKLLAFGNGGSSTDAQDMATLFLHPPVGARPLPALCLAGDVAVVTALANDIGFDVVFARPLAAAGRPDDIAMGLSTSGGSRNVLAGLDTAHEHGLLTVGLAGHGGGPMAEAGERGVVEHLFVVPSASVHRIQEAQTTIYQVLWELVQTALEPGPGGP
jgi:D-sedoheptulose 7-phosphate isomerase